MSRSGLTKILEEDALRLDSRLEQLACSANGYPNFGKYVISYSKLCTTAQLAVGISVFHERLRLDHAPSLMERLLCFSREFEHERALWASPSRQQIDRLATVLFNRPANTLPETTVTYNGMKYCVCMLAHRLRCSAPTLEFAMKSSGISWLDRVKMSLEFIKD